MIINKENLIAGVIAIIAFVAILCELLFGGISSVSISSAIKDIMGIFVDILVFVMAFKALFASGKVDFRGRLEDSMKKIEKSYESLIREHKAKETNQSDILKNQEFIRYDIAKNIDALFGNECNDYMRFFELKAKEPEEITFFIRKKFFGDQFNSEEISACIKKFCTKKYSHFKIENREDKDGAYVKISFGKVMRTKEDIESIISIVDDVLFLFIAICKK